MQPYGQQPKPSMFDGIQSRITSQISFIDNPSLLTDSLSQKLVTENTIPLLALNTEERKITVSKVQVQDHEIPTGWSFNRSNPTFEITTCLMPYTGQKQFAEAAIWGVDDRYVTLRQQAIEAKTYNSVVEPDSERAKEALKRSVTSIQGYFNQMNEKITGFNNRIPGIVASAIHNRKAELTALRKKAEDMDPFK